MSKIDKLLFETLRIRLVEEKIIEIYSSDLIQSPVHLSIGQEAVAVGICANLNIDDWVFITYRSHAFYLAKGGPLPQFFAELMGRVGGLSGGKAGSMHLASPKHGIMGASAIVGSTISHAVGAALAAKIKRESNRIFIANFGDGAMEQGTFFESLNFASLHKIPVLFLCEDNGLAVHTHLKQRQGFDSKKLVNSFGLPYFEISQGYDPKIVKNKSKKIIEYVRKNQAPAFLKVKTFRYREHVGPGEDFDAGYRSKSEFNSWRNLDPIWNKENFKLIEIKILDEINKALHFATNSSFPTDQDLLTDVI